MVRVSQTGGTLLDKIVDFIIPPSVVDFLNRSLLEKSWIVINYWSFVHLLGGVFFFFLFPSRLWTWIAINIAFEVVEFLLALGGNPLFVEETIDILWDLIWSIGGFLLAREVFKFFKIGKFK